MKKQIIFLTILIGLFGFAVSANAGMFDWLFQESQTFGSTSFNSYQIGSSATNGDILQTNGSVSTWVATSTLGITASETYD